MISITVPEFVRQVADEYKSTQEMSFGCLSSYFAMFLFGFKTLCETARAFPWTPSVSTLNKHLSRFSTNRFMRRLRAKVLRQIKEGKIDVKDCCYAVDDTIVEKYGSKVFRIGSWGKHGSGMIRGQRIMTLVLVVRSKGIAIPLGFEICPKKEDIEYRSGLDISLELIDSIISHGFPNLPVVFDSWFDSADLMTKISQRGLTFVIECKSNRKIKKSISPNAKWCEWNSLFHKKIRYSVKLKKTENSKRPYKTKYISEDYIFMRKYRSRLKAAVVYNKSYGKDYFGIYVTNNLKMSCAEIYSLSRSRWRIEEFFRCIKQNLGFLKIPTTNKESSYASISISFAIYVKIILSKYGSSEKISTTLDSMIKGIKESAFEKSLNDFSNKKLQKRILTLKIRRNPSRNNKKPINPTANELNEMICYAA
jgi:hypothetical protein